VQVRRRPDRGQQVGGQGQMQHLLLGHLDDHGLPSGHLGQLLAAEPFLQVPLEGELGEQVLAHQPVLHAELDPQRRLDRQSRLLASGWPDTDATREPTGPTRPLASADGLTTQVATC
jgi:hypothetical protein